MEVIYPTTTSSIEIETTARQAIDDLWKNFNPGGNDAATSEWSLRRDQILKEQLEKIRKEKTKREIEHEEEVEQLLTRKLPFEYLARDWFDENQV